MVRELELSNEQMSKVYLATLVCKSKRKDGEYIFDCISSMIGTVKNEIFISSNDHEYYSMTSRKLLEDEKLKFGYYNLMSILDLKKNHPEEEIYQIIQTFQEKYNRISYYVLTNDEDGTVVMSFDKDKWSNLEGDK
jgi:hypothetical protein